MNTVQMCEGVGTRYWRELRRAVLVLCAAVAFSAECGVVAARSPASDGPLRDWTLSDSISVRYFSGSQQFLETWPSGSESFIVSSPNRRYFFFVTHRGVLERDSNSYRLSVYDRKTLSELLRESREDSAKGVPPIATAEFEIQSSQYSAIRRPRWLADSSGIVFEGAESNLLQAFRLDVPSGRLTQLTRDATGLLEFAYRDGGLLYRSHIEAQVVVPYPMKAVDRASDGYAMQKRPVIELQWPGLDHSETRAISSSGKVWKVGGYVRFGEESVSPGGKYAVVMEPTTPERAVDGPWRFVLIDLQEGRRIGVMLDADTGPFEIVNTSGESAYLPLPSVLWAATGKRVALINTLVPPGGAKDSDSRYGNIVDYDIETRHWRVIDRMVESGAESGAPRYVSAIDGTSSQDELVLTYEGASLPASHVTYKRHGRTWVRREQRSSSGARATEKRADRGGAGEAGHLSVSVRQSANDPPVLIASDGKRDLALTTADPALEGIWRAPVEPFKWQDSDGRMQVAGLMRPRRQNGDDRRPPLVIQIAHYYPEVFLPDGTSSSGHAAQAFAAKGFVVLQIEQILADDVQKGLEPNIVARLDSAVDALGAKGLIDRSRVGVVGFSRNGFQALYTVTHPGKTRFAAAACLDSFSGTLTSYAIDAATSDSIESVNEFGRMNGGSFWDHKAQWLEHETLMNVDRVRTPVLFTVHSHARRLGQPDYSLDIIGAFRLNRKPMEYLYFPEGVHLLQRPLERLAAMQAVMDWMVFWLQDTSPADPDRRARWEPLRAQQNETLSRPAPPRVKWVAVPVGQ